jgi:hypothetical protein
MAANDRARFLARWNVLTHAKRDESISVLEGCVEE